MPINSYTKLISSIDLFASLEENQLAALIKEHEQAVKRYVKNEIIHMQNERCCSLDIILEGTVVMQKLDYDGSIMTIASFSSCDVFGENLLFSANKSYPLTVIAKTAVTVLSLKERVVLELCQESKPFLIEILRLMSEKTQILAGVIKGVARKSIRECIKEYLKYEQNLQNNDRIKLKITKKELAEKFGIQRTSLSRELNKMRKEGLIDFDRETITVLKREV